MGFGHADIHLPSDGMSRSFGLIVGSSVRNLAPFLSLCLLFSSIREQCVPESVRLDDIEMRSLIF